MADSLTQVPVSLLFNVKLSGAAKLVGVLARLGAGVRPSRLAQASGLARNTVLRALAELKAAEVDVSCVPGPSVPVPASLLTNRDLGVRARLLYGCLLLTPGYSHPSGRVSYAELAAMARVDLKTIRGAVAELVRTEWITVGREHRRAQIRFELSFPGLEAEQIALAAAEWRLGKAEFFGEALMREYLSLLIDSDLFEDDAAPGFLVNPRSQERLQFDRFYPPGVAFEFNGAQHYRATGRFTAEQVAEQQERDCIKAGISGRCGVTLVVVHPEDLSLAGMKGKVGSLLPLRDLGRSGIQMGYLEDEGDRYRRYVAHI